MVISIKREVLARLTAVGLRAEILARRMAIREHRDQKGDDRCWVDDFNIWKFAEGSPETPRMISIEWGMESCADFYYYRRAEKADPPPPNAILDPREWDRDLLKMAPGEVLDELVKIQQAIVQHRDVEHDEKRPRTTHDDRMLYAVLPEKIPADFRLPPESEFLGEAKAGAGCPQFWKSHLSCPLTCSLHKWGPCT